MNRIEATLAIERSLEINHQKIKRSLLKTGSLQEVFEEYDPNINAPNSALLHTPCELVIFIAKLI